MGGIVSSKQFEPTDQIPGQGPKVLEVAEKLNLSRSDLNQIYNLFRELDSDNSGFIDVSEFMVVNDISFEVFGELVFSLFDANKSGKLDFEEYMIAVWNYCTLHKDGLAQFAFDIFDVDSTGTLSIAEINEVIAIIWGYQKDDRLTKVLLTLNGKNAAEITSAEFIDMSKHFPVLLFPTFEVQSKLRKRRGESYWGRLADKRTSKFGEKTVFEILGNNNVYADHDTIQYIVRRLSLNKNCIAGADQIQNLANQMKEKSNKTKTPKKKKEKEEEDNSE